MWFVYGLPVRLVKVGPGRVLKGKRLINRCYLDGGKLDYSPGFVKTIWDPMFMDSLGKRGNSILQSGGGFVHFHGMLQNLS